MTNDIQTTTRQLAAIKVLQDLINERGRTARSEALELMSDIGAERVRVSMPDGAVLGTVTISQGRHTARVIDERAFLAWVRANAPSEVIETVRESYRKTLLKNIESTGEIPAGVELHHGEPYPTVRLADGATETVLTALRTGLIDPLALPAGGDQ